MYMNERITLAFSSVGSCLSPRLEGPVVNFLTNHWMNEQMQSFSGQLK